MRQPTQSDSEPLYVDDYELERRTSIARSTWQKWRYLKEGPPVLRVGKKCLYSLAEVIAWIESHRSTEAAK